MYQFWKLYRLFFRDVSGIRHLEGL
jgi:hypothetical protein